MSYLEMICIYLKWLDLIKTLLFKFNVNNVYIGPRCVIFIVYSCTQCLNETHIIILILIIINKNKNKNNKNNKATN